MRSFLLLLGLGILFPFLAKATMIIPYPNLGKLYEASDAVVVVTAGESYESTGIGCFHYDCDFKVLISAKGNLPADTTVTLRQYSYFDPFGRFDITGDFIPEFEHTYLIFLEEYEPGKYRPMMLSYYIFEASLNETDGESYWVPVESSLDIGVMPLPDGQQAEPLKVYKYQDLLDLLQTLADNPDMPWEPKSAEVDLPPATFASDRALPTGCDFDIGGGLSRWKNTAINMYYDITNAPIDAPVRYASTINMLNTEYPGLDLIFAGPTDFTPDCSDGTVSGNDFIAFENASLNGEKSVLLIFEDPCNQMPNITNCSGTLGIGGSYMKSTTHVYKGDTWKDAAWGYLVLNNGVRPCLTETNYDRLLAHELTHVFKMDHLNASQYPNQNMNPTCCNAINTKDRECMNYVYEPASQPLPVELTEFSAEAENDRIVLHWTTAREVNNDFFLVEKSTDGLNYLPLAEVKARNTDQTNRYEVVDLLPAGGQNYYRLIQVDFDGTRSNLGLRAVRFEGEAEGYVVLPNPVNGQVLFLVGRAGPLALENLEILDASGRLLRQYDLNNDPQTGSQMEVTVGDLQKGVYWLRIRQNGRTESVKFVRM